MPGRIPGSRVRLTNPRSWTGSSARRFDGALEVSANVACRTVRSGQRSGNDRFHDLGDELGSLWTDMSRGAPNVDRLLPFGGPIVSRCGGSGAKMGP